LFVLYALCVIVLSLLLLLIRNTNSWIFISLYTVKDTPHLRGCLLDSRLETQLKRISEIQFCTSETWLSKNSDIALANHFECIYDSSSAALTTFHFAALYCLSLAQPLLVNLVRLFLLNHPLLWFWWDPILHS
jgi:hypothetical protein